MLLTVELLVVLIGPRWRLLDGLEELYDEVHLNWPIVRTSRILLHLAPLLVSIALALVVPFLLAHYASPLLGTFRFITEIGAVCVSELAITAITTAAVSG